MCEPESDQAVIEWTHYKTAQGTLRRGTEWYLFDGDSGLIAEIRAYYASPQDPTRTRLELDDFDYARRGYPLNPRSCARGHSTSPRRQPRELTCRALTDLHKHWWAILGSNQ